MVKSSVDRYGSISQLLHWCTAIVVLIAFLYGPGGSEQRVYSATHEFDRRLHETLGLCVLALTVIRLLWKSIAARPGEPPAPPLMIMMSKLVQWALYLLLLALPLTAIAGAGLEGHPLTLLAGTDVQPWFGGSHGAGCALAQWRGAVAGAPAGVARGTAARRVRRTATGGSAPVRKRQCRDRRPLYERLEAARGEGALRSDAVALGLRRPAG